MVKSSRIQQPVSEEDAALRIVTRDGGEDEGAIAADQTSSEVALERANAKLAESEQRYRALVDHSPAGIFHSDANGETTWVNEAWQRITGLSFDEALGMGWQKALHAEDRQKIADEWQATVDEQRDVKENELRFVRPTGDIAWVQSRVVGVYDPEGNLSGYVGTIHDITRLKIAWQALQRSEERYRQLIEQSLDAVFYATPEDGIVAINPSGVALFGYETLEELRRAKKEEFFQNPADRDRFLEAVDRHGLIKDVEAGLSDRDGRPLRMMVTARAVRNPEGKLIGVRGILRDVTEKRQLEKRLAQAQKMEAVGRLAGGVAHDFNNLLTAILGYCDLLSLVSEESEILDHVREIRRSGERGAALTAQLLAFSRRQLTSPRVVNINRLIEDLERLLLRLIGENVLLRVDLDPAVQSVNADPAQLEQVITNLVINARDAMPTGGVVKIATSVQAAGERVAGLGADLFENEGVVIRVADAGVGISDSIRDQIFEPFFTTKDESKGTGLGLSTVYGVVSQSGGSIGLESAVNKGTTFIVRLPAVEALEPPTESEEAFGDEPRKEEGTVLVAEDEASVRSLVTLLLERQGYRVLTASCGAEAEELAQTFTGTIDLLLSDVVMPDFDGVELAERFLRSRPGRAVVLMSGYTGNREGVHQSGFPFLQKPFGTDELARTLRDAIDDAVDQRAS